MSPNKLYPRKILPEIINWLPNPQILLLIGSRQVGKTCLLHLIINELQKRNISNNSIHFFNLENPNIFNTLNSGPIDFIDHLKAHGVDLTKPNYIFIDEIQYLDNPSNFLKLLYDEYKTLKIIATGSSTLAIRQKFKDSLAGRKQVFEIHPLSFQEFLIFKQADKFSHAVSENSIAGIISGTTQIPPEILKHLTPEISPLFNEYSCYGGYPAVTLEPDPKKKSLILLEIYNSYIRKDIKDLMHIDNITAFNNLIQLLALQIGNLFNYHTITTDIAIARETLQKYLFLLENTFIIKAVSPYFTNRRKEITKMPKIYFHDIGLRNAILGNFQTPNLRPDIGPLMENQILSQLIKTTDPFVKIKFWRTHSKNEVDFIITKENVSIPLEVKYQSFKEPQIPTGLKSFINLYQPKTGIVITRDYLGKTDFGNATIWFLPPWFSEL